MLTKIIGGLITGMIVIIVGCSLLPEFSKPTNLIGWTIDEDKKQDKQTYEQYVRERINVERMMRK